MPEGETGVTLMATEAPRVIVDQLAREPEGLCASLALALESRRAPRSSGSRSTRCCVVGPEHGRVFREAGWDARAGCSSELFELTTAPRRRARARRGRLARGASTRSGSADPEMPVAKFAAPDRILLAYAGGDAGLF